MKNKKTIYLVVLNFNTGTVNLYSILGADQKRISKEIEETDQDSIVLQFMREMEHRESECHYMFSNEPIPVFSNNYEIEV
jgi:hypothetical protein